MNGALLVWLSAAMGVFVVANTVLRAYSGSGAGSGQWPVLLGALVMFCIGNLMMVRVMRESGLGLAIAVSSVLQLVLMGLVGMALFGERPTGLQIAGMVLGVVAVALIAWPQGGKA